MNAMKKRSTQPRRLRRQRGAALILTVVVIMVLTTLGMAMTAFTTTEERSATVYRDTLQVRSTAEAGVRLVQMMFAAPEDRQLVPLWDATSGSGDYTGGTESQIDTSLNAIGIFRAARTGMTPSKYAGKATNRLFRGPFAGSWGEVFGGSYSPTNDQYDLKFNCTNPTTGVAVPAADCWLTTNLNALLSASSDFNLDTGRITDISLYGPPSVNSRAYGIATVRVTAEKFDDDNNVLARETIVAVIGDISSKPAVLGDGNINFIVQGGVMCGDGCEQVHANGNATVGTISGGQDPMVTATGNVTTTAGSSQANTAAVASPPINPWDLAYRPTTTTGLDAYYLLAARPLDPVWTTGGSANNPAPRECGLTFCQDYNLEYDTSGNPQPDRTTASVPHMYKWNRLTSDWVLCTTGDALSCPGGPSFEVTRGNDIDVSAGAGADNAVLPFRKDRVPATIFKLAGTQIGATVLIDGRFEKHSGGVDPVMSIISAGSQYYHSDTEWRPALENRVMWISGRDIDLQSNCCSASNTCSTSVAQQAYAGIIAMHEQFYSNSQTSLVGLIIAEDRVNLDTTVDASNMAIDVRRGDHVYMCGLPDWPWAMPTRAAIFSMTSAAN